MFHRNHGSALITALFIMTLVAIAATAMSLRLQLDIYRTRLTLQSDRLYLASQAVTFWAMGSLQDKQNRFTKSDAQGKLLEFPKRFANISPNLVTKGYLYDLQGRFNLNSLKDNNYYPIFLRLMKHTIPDLNAANIESIAVSTRQWISPFLPGRGNDELFSYYLSQTPPYEPSQLPMQNVSEFRLIRGVNAKVYQSLSAFITALPEPTPINLNSASKQVLMSLAPGINEASLHELLQLRQKNGFTDAEKTSVLLQKLNIRPELVTLESQYFMSVSVISADDETMTVYAILKRVKNRSGELEVSLISESLNSL